MRTLFKFFAVSVALILSSQALAGNQNYALAASVPHESTICGNQNYALAA